MPNEILVFAEDDDVSQTAFLSPHHDNVDTIHMGEEDDDRISMSNEIEHASL